MRNEEIIEAFLNKKRATNSTGSLSSTGSCLYSYATCIAEYNRDGDIVVNNTRYSTTTSHHQTLLKRRIHSDNIVSGKDRGVLHLLKLEERWRS